MNATTAAPLARQPIIDRVRKLEFEPSIPMHRHTPSQAA